jgi:hypothetical protein
MKRVLIYNMARPKGIQVAKAIDNFAYGMKRLFRLMFVVTVALFLAPGAAFAADGSGTPGLAGSRFGLDAMMRGEAARHFDLGTAAVAEGEDDTRGLVRLRPSFETGQDNSWRGRIEGQWYGLAGRQDLSAVMVYQAYLEGSLPGTPGLTAKVGRQELVYGSTFLLGADTFYDGQSWDAARLTLRPADRLSVDLFGGRYVKRNSGGIEGTLYGIYGTILPQKDFTLDLYGLRDTGGVGATHAGGAHEVTWSVGARAAARFGERLDLEAEPVWQFGRKADGAGGYDPIAAFGGHVDLTFRPAPARFPGKLFGGFAWGSGDGNPGDHHFREFHNPNNDTPQVGDMNVIGDLSGLTVAGHAASGLRILTLGGAADLSPAVNLSLTGHAVRADQVPAGFSKALGVEADLALAWTVRDGLCVTLGADRFFTGGFFRDATGREKDIDYGYLQLQAAI